MNRFRALHSRGIRGRHVLTRPVGATAVEYVVIIVLVSLSLVAVIELFAGGVGHQLDQFSELLRADVGRDSASQAGQSGGSGAAPQGSVGQGTGGGSSASAPRDASGAPTGQAMPPAEGEPAAGSVGGINPVILIIVGILLALLAYVVFGKKKG